MLNRRYTGRTLDARDSVLPFDRRHFLALGQGDDRHPCETQAPEDTCHVLIATDAIQRLRQNQVETARLSIGKNRLNTGADKDVPEMARSD